MLMILSFSKWISKFIYQVPLKKSHYADIISLFIKHSLYPLQFPQKYGVTKHDNLRQVLKNESQESVVWGSMESYHSVA